MKWYKNYIEFASQRLWLLILLIVLVIVAGLPIINTKITNRPIDWYPKSSRQLPDKKAFLEHFGNDETIILFLTFPDSISNENKLDELYSISENIRKIYGFEQNFSRLNLESAKGLINASYLNKLKDIYFKSNNENGEVIFLKVRKHKQPDANRPKIVDSLHTLVLNKIPPTVKSDLTGPGLIFSEIDRISKKDSAMLFSACYVLIFLLLWWRLRKASYLFLCSLMVLLALWPALSLFGWLDIPINMITLVVPLLFIINFFSFAVHLVAKQSKEISPYLRKKVPPILTSALTNIIGFGSLMLSDIQVIYQFGILTSLGIIIGLLVLFFIGTPLVIRWIEVNKNVEKADWMNHLLDGYYKRLSKTVAVAVTLIMICWIIFGVLVFPKIKVDTDTVGFLRPENEIRVSKDYIEKHYGSISIIEFIVDKTDSLPFTKENWKTIANVQKQLATVPYVTTVVTYSAWKPLITELKYSAPDQAEKLSAAYLSKNQLHSRITIRIPAGTVKQMEKNINQVQQKINSIIGNEPISVRSVGFIPAYIEQTNIVVSEMLESLLVAVLLIMTVMSIFVRNFKIGLIATVVTVFPLFAVTLLMHWLNIPFDIATSVIFSVVVGMIADDALHIIWAFKNNLHLRSSYSTNILFADSVRNIVHPCTATSIMFAVGFAVLTGSQISLIVNFGILSASAIVFSWFSHFFFFPAILRLFYPDKKK